MSAGVHHYPLLTELVSGTAGNWGPRGPFYTEELQIRRGYNLGEDATGRTPTSSSSALTSCSPTARQGDGSPGGSPGGSFSDNGSPPTVSIGAFLGGRDIVLRLLTYRQLCVCVSRTMRRWSARLPARVGAGSRLITAQQLDE